MQPVVVCGFPYSGTKYSSVLLSSSWLDIGHETMGKDGTSDCQWLFDPSLNGLEDPKTLFVSVRHPARLLKSVMNIPGRAKFFCDVAGAARDGKHLFHKRLDCDRVFVNLFREIVPYASYGFRMQQICSYYKSVLGSADLVLRVDVDAADVASDFFGSRLECPGVINSKVGSNRGPKINLKQLLGHDVYNYAYITFSDLYDMEVP